MAASNLSRILQILRIADHCDNKKRYIYVSISTRDSYSKTKKAVPHRGHRLHHRDRIEVVYISSPAAKLRPSADEPSSTDLRRSHSSATACPAATKLARRLRSRAS